MFEDSVDGASRDSVDVMMSVIDVIAERVELLFVCFYFRLCDCVR